MERPALYRSNPSHGSIEKGSSRIFFTSLGHPGDFARPEFRKLLKNAIFWALDRQSRPRQTKDHYPDRC